MSKKDNVIDLILLSAIAVIFGLKISLNFIIIAIIGFLIGLFFGGLSLLLKLIPSLILVFAVPIGLAFYLNLPFEIMTIVFVSGPLFIGYVAGSLLSIVFLPVKIIGKIFKFVIGIFSK